MSYYSGGLMYQKGASNPCITPARLAQGAAVSWDARAECAYTFIFGWVCKAGGGQWSDTLDGIELEVTIAPTDTSKPWLTPQSGCIVAHPNYNSGEGTPDCAIIRSTGSFLNDTWTWSSGSREGQGVGRFAVHGTIYAPSAAVDVDDGDAAYSLVERGAVLRHLRISGYGQRSGTDNPAIGHHVDRTPLPRDALFVACRRTPANENAPDACGSLAGDTVLTKARVRFEIDPSASIPEQDKARVPKIEWWSTSR